MKEGEIPNGNEFFLTMLKKSLKMFPKMGSRSNLCYRLLVVSGLLSFGVVPTFVFSQNAPEKTTDTAADEAVVSEFEALPVGESGAVDTAQLSTGIAVTPASGKSEVDVSRGILQNFSLAGAARYSSQVEQVFGNDGNFELVLNVKYRLPQKYSLVLENGLAAPNPFNRSGADLGRNRDEEGRRLVKPFNYTHLEVNRPWELNSNASFFHLLRYVSVGDPVDRAQKGFTGVTRLGQNFTYAFTDSRWGVGYYAEASAFSPVETNENTPAYRARFYPQASYKASDRVTLSTTAKIYEGIAFRGSPTTYVQSENSQEVSVAYAISKNTSAELLLNQSYEKDLSSGLGFELSLQSTFF